MKKYPKYIVLPAALAIYFVVMAVYSYHRNGNRLPEDFVTIVAVEAVILVALFAALRYLGRRRS